jgi:hypothetical protein
MQHVIELFFSHLQAENLTLPYILNTSGSVAVLKETTYKSIMVNHIIILAQPYHKETPHPLLYNLRPFQQDV